MSDQEAVEDVNVDVENDDVDVEDVDVDVENYDEKPLLPANVSLMLSKCYANEDDDEPWEAKLDSSSSDECDADKPTCFKLLQTKATERQILVPKKILKNSNFSTLTSDKELNKLQSGVLQTSKKRKDYPGDDADGMDVNSKIPHINLDDNCEADGIFMNKKRFNGHLKSGEHREESTLNINPDNGQGFSEPLSDMSDSTSSTNPSCSKDLAGPSGSTDRLHVGSDLLGTNVDNNLITKVLMNICNKSYLTDSLEPIVTPEENVEHDLSAISIEQCQFLENVLGNLNSSTGEGSDYQVNNSQEFVEEDDIVNPDIMYNIDLNEHYKEMDMLVEKIVTTTTDNDQTQSILNECMQLAPIPRVQHKPVTFTARERSNYMHGISEYEYEINGEDWNKIMVKRAVIFTAHAGFNIANEESLYVLADVAIDYIKKLAITFKRNFDIQLNSSFPHVVDPITNSLHEIGVHGGIPELIRHYDNDVFGRRVKLTEQCEHLQQIIDGYVERGGNPIEPNANDHRYAAECVPRDESTADGVAAEAVGRVTDGGFDLLKPFAGYALHDPESVAEDVAKVERMPRTDYMFNLRDYEIPYKMQAMNCRSLSSSAAGNNSLANIDNGPFVTPAAARGPNAWVTRDNKLASELRNTLINDLEERFRRFTSLNNEANKVPSAESHAQPEDETHE